MAPSSRVKKRVSSGTTAKKLTGQKENKKIKLIEHGTNDDDDKIKDQGSRSIKEVSNHSKIVPSSRRASRSKNSKAPNYKDPVDSDLEGEGEEEKFDDDSDECYEEEEEDKGYNSKYFECDIDHIDSEAEDKHKKIRSSLKNSTKNIKKNNNKSDGVKQVPKPGTIAQSTMDFLENLSIPDCNNRDWLISNDKIYREALNNWKEFIEFISPKVKEIDWTIPRLPSKDLIYRLNRDVRFSNDKTPYKKNFSAGFSRTGKKGPWAFYYLELRPGNKTFIGGGVYCPEKNQLAAIRNSIIRNSKPLREVISSEEFVKTFGKPEEGKGKDKRQNIFGHDDALKTCPKIEGIDKSHPDIDLLKLKTIVATKHFSDQVVTSDSFVDELSKIIKAFLILIFFF
ncbi:hypothetical protein BY996DRAFT_8688142 [Phakopsora pachyrhizi]|nr:hypothetical protein BY996DRAFT_8688142 [Phakopsora pachyrhizi]